MQRHTTSVNYSYYDKSGQSRSDQRPKKGPSKPVGTVQSTKPTNVQQDRLDIVTKDRNWIQTVSKEKDVARTWQRNWALLSDYDPKGELKATTATQPDRSVIFSNQVPNTTSGHYGAYLHLEPSRNIQLFEQKFNCSHRKRPIDSDLGRP